MGSIDHTVDAVVGPGLAGGPDRHSVDRALDILSGGFRPTGGRDARVPARGLSTSGRDRHRQAELARHQGGLSTRAVSGAEPLVTDPAPSGCDFCPWQPAASGHRLWICDVRCVNLGGVLVGLTCLGTAGVLTYPLWRTWCLTWGATADEVDSSLPGDDLLTGPDCDHHPRDQIGVTPADLALACPDGPRPGRRLHLRLDREPGRTRHAQCRRDHPRVPAPRGRRRLETGAKGPVLRVASCEPDTSLVLRSDDGNWVWAFVLARVGTGLVSSAGTASANRAHHGSARMITRYVMEPGSLVMERKMLLGIKERVERPAVPPGTTMSVHSEPTSRHAAPSSGATAASS